jgi:hypothetical protein
MANTKKSAVENEEIIETEVVEEVKSTPKKVAKVIKHEPGEYIICRSVKFGELILIGPKTHTPYRWLNEGDVAEVEYQDLLSWKAQRHKYLFEPMIIIEDEELVEEWNTELGKLYSELQNIDIKALFKLPQRQFVAQLKKLNPGMKSTVQNMAYAMIQDGALYDLRIIKAIDETLGTELMMMIN